MLCRNCGKPLIESQYSEDGKYKSCPRCSMLNGEEHVYFPYPSGFGTSYQSDADMAMVSRLASEEYYR